VAGENTRRELKGNGKVRILDDQYEPLQGADALAVVTDWNQFRNPNFGRIKETLHLPVIFDGRNLYQASFLNGMGFTYFAIGRPTTAKG
jgi:UDPglucose 6-dehydrogenase